MTVERQELLNITAELHKRIAKLEAENKALLERVEKAEDTTDDAWLDAIAKYYHKMSGQAWDVLDGETSEEGRERNVTKLFQMISEEREAKERAKAACAEMRSTGHHHLLCKTQRAAQFAGHCSCGWSHALSSDCGQPLLDRMRAMTEILNEVCADTLGHQPPCAPNCPRCRWKALKEGKP